MVVGRVGIGIDSLLYFFLCRNVLMRFRFNQESRSCMNWYFFSILIFIYFLVLLSRLEADGCDLDNVDYVMVFGLVWFRIIKLDVFADFLHLFESYEHWMLL